MLPNLSAWSYTAGVSGRLPNRRANLSSHLQQGFGKSLTIERTP